MARLSQRNLLYLKISNSLSDSDVKALRASIVKDGHIGVSKVQKATPHEIFIMLEDDARLPEGDLSLLSSLLRGLHKWELAEEAEDLAGEERGESPLRRTVEVGIDPPETPDTRGKSKKIKLGHGAECATGLADEGNGTWSAKRVFISYSQDPHNNTDPSQRDADIQLQRTRVKSLADELRRNGVDCMIDQYAEYNPPDMWTTWMQNQIVQADYVLMVCTPHYLECITGQKSSESLHGHNASFEGKVIFGQLSNPDYYKKFLPVFFDKIDRRYVPPVLQGCHMYGPIEYPARYGQEKFNILLSKILGRVLPEKCAPEMGKPPSPHATT
ncbi:Hypp8819 [Branchiostoma lanceolatum]|uniref:Hypp8819 protein n=1 Tax=Branchiostoma lanceolatum TaxID=7740 RepID=A0A8J9ZB58_BRALA|nr:Hypp8819 [Branchiostoma lanceolatum]